MSLNEKREAAMKFLGSNWVLHKYSTYDVKRRDHSRFCKTLHYTYAMALVGGRL